MITSEPSAVRERTSYGDFHSNIYKDEECQKMDCTSAHHSFERTVALILLFLSSSLLRNMFSCFFKAV